MFGPPWSKCVSDKRKIKSPNGIKLSDSRCRCHGPGSAVYPAGAWRERLNQLCGLTAPSLRCQIDLKFPAFVVCHFGVFLADKLDEILL